MEVEKNITLLTESVRRQREIAQEALDEAREIDDILQTLDINPELKGRLEKAKSKALKIASDLAANATSTSSSAQVAFELISNLAKK
jgi:hypothetical protein